MKRNDLHQLRHKALCIALGMCFAGAAWADTGGLRIAINDGSGQPLVGATVKVSSPDSLVSKTGVTDSAGRLRLSGLDPATNYTVKIEAPGYREYTAANVAVVSGKELNLGYKLSNAAAASADTATLDTVTVTGAALAAIDTTSATVSSVLTLEQVESLPTGRSYQSYLQLVPGVKPSASGNPSSKSGVNYSDIGGTAGASTDNVYMLDGVDVTDPSTGTFGANFNSEIIQEQQVITGGVPAEYAGGSGLVAKVVTKSGSNDWHGSLNYYMQNDSLVADNKHNTASGFSTYDTAFTLGGPILQDKLWFFASYQKKYRETDVVNAQTGEFMRTVESDAKYAFFKTTWQITEHDRLTGTFFNDPTDITGTTTSSTLNNRDYSRKQGGDNYKFEYSHDWEKLRLTAYGFRHEGELSDSAADASATNTIAFRSSAQSSLAHRNLGGLGSDVITERNRDEFGASVEYWLDTAYGSHTFKLGITSTKNEYFENTVYTGDKARYTSIDNQYSGLTLDQAVNNATGSNAWTTRPIVGADYGRIIDGINENPNKAYFLGLLDGNGDGDGAVSTAELGAYRLTSTAGNPGGYINNYRMAETLTAPYTVSSKGKTFYLQDTWTLNQWSVNAGVRAEQWKHYDSKGGESAKFDWEFAPRLSVVYDLFGDGRSKVWGFYGRYYDPVRNNISDFAGNLTGPSYAEQIYLGDQWLTFRTRGGEKEPDALFAPSTKTPYTDEMMLGFSTTFRDDLSLTITATRRVTKNVLEDYDLGMYSEASLDPADPEGNAGKAAPGSFYYLPLSYFGYDSAPNSNYVIGTLAGGERKYMGYEITLQKFRKDNWQGSVSYTFNDAKGNTNSDSNADYQGDWIALDPRAPNIWGPQAGNIKHQLKGWASYAWNNGLEISGVFNWNSGMLYTTSQLAGSRYLPVMGEEYVERGVYDTWVLPGSVGAHKGPSSYTLDARVKYNWALPFGKLEFFLDIFNILDKQSTTAVEGLVTGGAYDYGQASAWNEPRRFYLGARYAF